MSKVDVNDIAREHGSAALAAMIEEKANAAPELADLDPFKEDWPEPLAPEALHGLAGDVVRTILPHTEADAAALLFQFLAAYGNAIGRGTRWRVGGDEHCGNLYGCLVGKSGKGRKGTSWGEIRRLFQHVEAWSPKDNVQSGLSSAEGLIWAVHDEVRGVDKKGNEFVEHPAVEDKRLFVLEPEFANVLKQQERTGNTLSATIRQAWECGYLQSMTKNSPAKATGAHISIFGHITKQELLRFLNGTETANGFANRILWVCVQRSKLLPDGDSASDTAIAALRSRLIKAIAFGSQSRVMKRDADAAKRWREIYGELSEERAGMAATLCGRAEAQVMRMAMLFALLDESDTIGLRHLNAGLAAWHYCAASVRCIFGDALGDPTADEIALALKRSSDGMSRNEIRALFGNHKTSTEIDRALGVLIRASRIYQRPVQTAGRPKEVWFWKP